MRRLALFLLCWPLLLQLPGCERAMRDMYDQPRAKAYGGSALFADGAASRSPPPGAVVHARGALPGSSSGRLGARESERRADDDAAPAQPHTLDMPLLARGRERYGIYCLPCHSPVGDGDGRVARRGFPSPPSYHSDRLRRASDRHIYEVISQGYGVMPSYAGQIEPADRWAIVAYVRALQVSQHADVDRLPGDLARQARQALGSGAAASESKP